MRTVDTSELRWRGVVSIFCDATVDIQRHGLFVVGPPSVVAGALLGRALGHEIAKRRAARLTAPQWRILGGHEVILTDQSLVVRRSDDFDISVPFRTIVRWDFAPGGIWIQRAGWAPLSVSVNDPKSFLEWFPFLVEGNTWRPPILELPKQTGPIVDWCQHDHRFTFGIPQGWFPGERDWLAWWEEDYAPARVIAGVRRLEGSAALIMLVLAVPPNEDINAKMIEDHADEIAAQMATWFGGTFDDPIRLVDLDGDCATLFHLSRRAGPEPMEVDHFFVVHEGQVFAGRFAGTSPVGDAEYRRARPDLDSMLATWHWYP